MRALPATPTEIRLWRDGWIGFLYPSPVVKDSRDAAPLFCSERRGGGVCSVVLVRYLTIFSYSAIAFAILFLSGCFVYVKESVDAPKSLFQNQTLLPPDL